MTGKLTLLPVQEIGIFSVKYTEMKSLTLHVRLEVHHTNDTDSFELWRY